MDWLGCLGSFGDERLKKGALRFCRSWSRSKRAVSASSVGAGQATGTRVGGRRVLVIQDTTELNFAAHKASKRGFGTVGNGVDIGFFLPPTHAITDLSDALRIVGWYRRRWVIEQIFRILKGQGLAIEDSRIVDPATLAKLATTALIAAIRVMQLVHARDGTLARAAWVIGRLGGWSGYSGGGYKPPGPKTMHDGLCQFDAIKHGWGLARKV